MSNHFNAKGSTRRELQKFFLNSEEVFGVQNIGGDYEQPFKVLKFLGMDNPIIVPDGEQIASFRVSTLLIDTDKFISLTGHSGVNGYVLKDQTDFTRNFSFTSGYLTPYRSSCSIGEIPTIESEFIVLGDIGKLETADSDVIADQANQIATASEALTPQIAGPGSISINLSDFSTNRILSYSFEISVERNPIYPLGGRFPYRVEINYPIQSSLSLQFAVNDYEAMKLRDFPTITKTQDINLVLKTFNDNTNILSYNLTNATLVNESYAAGVDGQTVVTANYVAYSKR